MLCHKPGQLEQVAADIDAGDTIVVSLLGGVALAAVRAAYPGARVYRIMPNTAVEIRSGVIGLVDDDAGDPQAFAAVQELFGPAGEVIVLPEAQLGPLTARLGRRPGVRGARRRGADRRRRPRRDPRAGRRAPRRRRDGRRRGAAAGP